LSRNWARNPGKAHHAMERLLSETLEFMARRLKDAG
jgi:hypothetical protein